MIDDKTLAKLHSNYLRTRGMPGVGATPQPEQATETKTKDRGLLGFLPMITGLLGGVGGSFLAPGVGTAAGGAAGAGIGEWLAQKFSGEDTDIGRIAGEGALGTLGGVGRLFKTVGAAGKAVKAGQGGDLMSILRSGSVSGKPAVSSAVSAAPAPVSARPTPSDLSMFSGAPMSGVEDLAQGPKSAIFGPQKIPVQQALQGELTSAQRPTQLQSLFINPTAAQMDEIYNSPNAIKRIGELMSRTLPDSQNTPYVMTGRTRIPVRTPTELPISSRIEPLGQAATVQGRLLPRPELAYESGKTSLQRMMPTAPRPKKGTDLQSIMGQTDETNLPIQNGGRVPFAETPGGVAMTRTDQLAGEAYKPQVSAVPGPAEVQVPGARQKIADWLTRRGSGLRPGKSLGADSLDKKVRVHQRHDITGTPKRQLDKIRQTITDLDDQVDQVLVDKAVPMKGSSVRGIVNKNRDDPTKFVYSDLNDELVDKYTQAELLKRFDSAKTAKEINDRLKVINPKATAALQKAKTGQGTLTAKEQALIAVKEAGDEALASIPEIKPLKTDMAVLFDSFIDVAHQLDKAGNIPIVGGALKAPAAVGKYIQSKMGTALSKGAKATSTKPKVMTPGKAAKSYAGTQAGVRGAQALLGPGVQQTAPDDVSGTDVSGTAPFDLTALMGAQEQPQGLYTREKMEADIKRDPANWKDYIGFYNEYNKATGGTAANLTAQQKQQLGKFNTAESILNEFESMLNKRGGSDIGPVAAAQGVLANLGASVNLDTDAKSFNRLRQGLSTQLAKALGESGAMTEGDIQRALALIPDYGLTPEQRANQLAVLRSQIAQAKQGIKGLAGGNAGGGVNLQQLMAYE